MTTTTNNLIEQVGGIEKAKAIVEGAPDSHYCTGISDYTDGYDDDEKCPDCVGIQDLRTAIAQYEQGSNSSEFKVGEKIVYRNLSYERLFYIKAVLTDSIVIHECLGEAGAKCFSEFHPYSDIRHATPAEIKAGRRLDHSENVTDMVTDIRNHISPNTKVVEL